MELIKVKNDWTWVCHHVDELLNSNEKLNDDILMYIEENKIDLDRIKEMYLDGIEHGIEDGKYLSFETWFYEFIG